MDLEKKKAELHKVVKNLDLPTSLAMMGILLEHSMKLSGFQKKQPVIKLPTVGEVSGVGN